MNATTTTEADVLRYLYGETSQFETRQVRLDLLRNPKLKIFHDRMLATILELNTIKVEPSNTSVNIILEFSASHHDSLEHLG